MTAEQLMNRLEKLRSKRGGTIVYLQLVKLPVEEVVTIIEKVDDILFEEQIQQSIQEIKQILKSKLK